MRTAAILGLVLSSFSVVAQTLTGAAVHSTGRMLDLYITGLPTNGTFALGWGMNNYPTGTERIRLTVTSPTFRKSGNSVVAGTLSRYVWGGAPMEIPGTNTLAVAATGSGIIATVSLSDYVFSADTSITLDASSGWYSHGGSNVAAVSSMIVTNTSSALYPKPPGRFAWPGWQRVTGPTMTVWAAAGASQRPWPFLEWVGKPVSAIQFKVTDTSGNSSTSVVDRVTSAADIGMPTVDLYRGDLVVTNMVSLAALRVDMRVFPIIGDTNAVWDTADNLHSGATSLPSAITNVYDPSGNYSRAVAVVSTNGSDTLGRVGTNDPTSISSSNYFLTLAKAAQAIRTNNSTLYGHDDVGGGIVYGRTGVATWLGSSQSYGTGAVAWLTFTPYPGDTLTLTNQVSNQDAGDRVKVLGVNIDGAANLFSGSDWLWLDQCTISNTGTALIQSAPSFWLTRSTVNTMSQGLRPFSTQNTGFLLVGNTIAPAFGGTINPMLAIGNYRSGRSVNTACTWVTDVSASSSVPTEFIIWQNNYIAGLQNSSGEMFYVAPNRGLTNGIVCLQNAFIATTNTQVTFNWGSSVNAVSNWFSAHNYNGGGRDFEFYNDSGTSAPRREFISRVGDLREITAFKSHDFVGGPNAVRTNNWGVQWGVGYRFGAVASLSVAGVDTASFPPDWAGLGGYHPAVGITNDHSWLGFRNRVAASGSTTDGLGDFRINSHTPIWGATVPRGQPRDYVLPRDLDGLPRSLYDPPGPFRGGQNRQSIVNHN